MALSTINCLELCAGTGMLGVAVELALKAIGVRAVPVCYIEREAVAAASLVARMEVTGMGFAPIWDDIGTFDCGPWAGLVDCICGGYPCQPHSCAGKRLGTKDERFIWPRIREIVEEIQPSFCFFENVPGHLNSGFDRVVEDLEGLDYRVAAGLFSSQEVGAPMQNDRLYILAARYLAPPTGPRCSDGENTGTDRQDERTDRSRGEQSKRSIGKLAQAEDSLRRGESGPGTTWRRRPGSSGIGTELASPFIQGFEIRPGQPADIGKEFPAPQRSGGELDATDSNSPQGRPDIGQNQIQVAEQPDPERTGGGLDWHYPPNRNDWRSWRIVAGVDPARMPAAERQICGVANGMASRADQLRLIGNGVDPLAAAYAFLHLLAHFE